MHLEIREIISSLTITVSPCFLTVRLPYQVGQMYRGQLPGTVFVRFDPRYILEGKEGPSHCTLSKLNLVDLTPPFPKCTESQEIIPTAGTGSFAVRGVVDTAARLFSLSISAHR